MTFRKLFLVLCILLPLSSFAKVTVKMGIKDHGLVIGNTENWTGIRINFKDQDVERVTGINAALWTPGDNNEAIYNGLSLGLLASAGKTHNGVAIGSIAIASECIHGFSAALVGVVSEDNIGVSLAGIGGVYQSMDGISVCGIGMAGDSFRGFAISGIGGATDRFTGITINGVGFATDCLTGIGFSGIGLATDSIKGIGIAGIGIASDQAIGLITGARVAVEEAKGASLAVIWMDATSLKGVGTGLFCRSRESLTGISIGIVNTTSELHGIQIGLLNHAGNNHKYLRYLPGINIHF